MGYLNTSNFVKNTPLHVVFSTLSPRFSDVPMKHYLLCLIYYFINQNLSNNLLDTKRWDVNE